MIQSYTYQKLYMKIILVAYPEMEAHSKKYKR